jgi:ribosomal protein S3AE
MQIDTIQITNLPPLMMEAVENRAKEIGTTAEEYVRYLIEEDLASTLSMRVLFAPVREQIRESGVSEAELDELLEEAREEVYQENNK